MKNEIIEYIKINKDNLLKLTEEIKSVINERKTTTNADTLVFMNLLEYLINEKMTEDFLIYLNENIDNEIFDNVKKIISDDKDPFLESLVKIRNEIENTEIKLVDLDWKFIGLLDINANDLREMDPKILLKLIFSNDSYRIIETNYSNLRKLQEEIEENIQSFNSIYTKRIINFSK